MKRAAIIFVTLLMLVTVSAFNQTVPQVMNFQGRLAKPDGTPIPDTNTQTVTFRLFAAGSGGNALWQQVSNNVAVHNGIFAAPLNFAAGYQNGNTLATIFGNALFTPYLEIQVSNAAPLTPRQPFASVAYALYALSVPDGSISNAKIAAGTITADKLASGVLNGSGWSLTGNAATNPAVNFLGTTDNQPLVLKVNGQQAMRYDFAGSSNGYGLNMLGGAASNTIDAGVFGATIGGGGFVFTDGSPGGHHITGSFGVISGGLRNTAGVWGFVGGGDDNTANTNATVGGGGGNRALGYFSSIPGGSANAASGQYSVIPGGAYNIASGDYSFAGGQQAQANNTGSFVWNDASNTTAGSSFASTAANQFLIHAAGGVGINTNTPQAVFEVNGTFRARNNATLDGSADIGAGATLYNGYSLTLRAVGGSTDAGDIIFQNGDGTEKARIFSDPASNNALLLSTNGGASAVAIQPNGNVGIGTSTPQAKLDVNGTTRTNGFMLPVSAETGLVLTSDASGNGTWQAPPRFTLPYSDYLITFDNIFSIVNAEIGGGGIYSRLGGIPLSYPFDENGAIRGDATSYVDGVIGTSQSGSGVFGYSSSGGYGVIGRSDSNNGYGIYGFNSGGGYAGYFAGTVGVSGNLNVFGPVTISGVTNRTFDYGYLASTGKTGRVTGETNTYSLVAGDRIAATEFNAYSDARIKRRIGRSDADNDLNTLLGLEITDYTMIDTIGQSKKPYKKVIAQQVEKVFPQAVSRMTGVIPDIYQKAQVQNGWVRLATNLKAGERVKLITEKEEAVYDVMEANAQGFRVALPDVKRAFVYGREVKDFRSVDYDALAMLNVSATQAMHRKMTHLEASNAVLRQQNEALETRMQAVERTLAQLADPKRQRTVRQIKNLASRHKPVATKP